MVRHLTAFGLFAGGAELGALMRAHDWSRSPLKSPETWPGPLRTVVQIMLAANQPMFAAWGPERAMVYNDAYAEILGPRHPSALGRPFLDVWSELRDSVGPLVDRAYAGEPSASDDLKLVLRRHGFDEETHFSFFYAPLRDEAGAVTGLYCACSETTDKVLAERRTAFRLGLGEQLRDLSDPASIVAAAAAALGWHLGAARVGYAEIDDAGQAAIAREWNPAGLPTIVGRHWLDDYGRIRVAELRAGRTDVIADFGADRRLGAAEIAAHRVLGLGAQIVVPMVKAGRLAALLFVHAAAVRHWTKADVAAAEDAAEHTWAAVERSRAEAGLRASEARLAQLFEQAPTFMALLEGPEHRVERANPGYMRLVGHRPVLGKPIAEALPEAVEQGYVDLLDQVYRTGEPFEASGAKFTPQPAPGSPVEERFVDFVFQPMRDAAGQVTGIFVEGADVTARAVADAALRENEARLRALNADLERQVIERSRELGRTWQVSPDLLGVCNAAARFERTNPAWQTMLGWNAEEIAKTPFLDFVHPDDVERTREAFAQLERGEPVLRFENRYRRKQGGHRWLSWVAVPEAGLIYCSARDVTEEKERTEALARAEEALRQSQKMESIGQLTGGLAHDFNNMLQGIGSALHLVERRLEQGRTEDVPRLIEAAQRSVERAASLTHRLLAFARRQRLDAHPVQPDLVVEGMVELVRRTVGPSIEVRTRFCDGSWPVLCDVAGLESALLNLAINARDAMPDGGTLTIATAEVRLAAADLPGEEDALPGEYAAITVADTGTGMTPDVLARVFEPFFTTKPIGKGTGLGLSQLYGFVHQSGGLVRIGSAPGQGTTVRLYLPRHDAAAVVLPEIVLADDPVAPASRTILLVEDEPAIRAHAADALREQGYQVLEAEDGPSGLRTLTGGARVDLLVTDVGLPGLNGRQLADAARERRPELPVLFITGYAGLALNGLDPGMSAIAKPFGLDMLLDRVGAMLTESHPG